MRILVAVADAGQFQEAAADLSITQQAVSKRVAALENDLGVRLFTRTARGARPTIDGRAFLPHARALLRAERRAVASVRPGRRAVRVDVIGRRLAPADLLSDFKRAHPDTELDAVTLFVGERTRLVWSADHNLRRVALRDPTPVYPHSLVWRGDNPPPVLTAPRDHLAATRPDHRGDKTWTPGWAR
ncbi:LysR family transcriptional regulator [Thermobifida halotolerans]|uniref:LysR family transcriptional regulator n=1 Tax=Thermobifida halotolerans TaxID=483545 RepID=A0AA97M0W0_9ACTN|nr:LysR family transcriptional regulator [Thermobifida halotolerans]